MTTASARNAGLRRVSRLTRWVAAGAIGVTAAFSVMAARATAGKAPTSSPSPSDQVPTPASAQPPIRAGSAPTASDPASRGGLSQDPGQSNAQPAPLTPPTQAPRPNQQIPVVVSGSS